jgi:hypothetical protein
MEISLYEAATRKQKRLYRIRFGTKFNRRKPGDIKRRRVERVLKFLKNNKAAGQGGIPTELLKYGGKNEITSLTDMFNEILAGEDIPQEWNSVYICSIYKN